MKNLVQKIGHYVHGTDPRNQIQISTSSIGKAPVLNLAWHIGSEIKVI